MDEPSPAPRDSAPPPPNSARAAHEAELQARMHPPPRHFDGAEIVEAIEALNRKRTGVGQGLLILVVSAALFLLVGYWQFEPIDLALLLVILFLHELGHYLGMLAFGYRDLRILFIPALGAAATGRKEHAEDWQEALVSLLGPAPGIACGSCLLLYDAASGGAHPALRRAGELLLVVNGFNLLPFFPLGGGHFWNRVLFARSPLAEGWFKFGTGLALAGLGFWMDAWLLVGFGLLFALGSSTSMRTGRLAHRLKPALEAPPGAPPPPLTPEVAEFLSETIQVESPFLQPKKASDMAFSVRELWERIQMRSSGWGPALGLIALYFVILFMGLGSAVAYVVVKGVQG
ncbi:MAG: hypothetical protein M5U26_05955 [Planctomycetota bacterium]|nr:hypothetical protein [Planctomycetota bacterium]